MMNASFWRVLKLLYCKSSFREKKYLVYSGLGSQEQLPSHWLETFSLVHVSVIDNVGC